MSGREFVEWKKFYNIYPFGYERHDLGTGIIAAQVYNANRGKGKQAKQARDFMPKFKKKGPKIMTVKEMQMVMGGYKAKVDKAYGGQPQD